MRHHAFVPRDYDGFAGLDVDKRSISVTFTDHQGLSRSMRIPYSVEQLLSYVGKYFVGQKVAVAYEAGPTGYGLYDGLVAHGAPCVVASPSMIPRAPGQRVKTNRLDSRGLSETLRGGQLQSIHVPAPPYRDLRQLIQLRDTFVSELVGMKLRLKALVLLEGIAFPPAPAGSQWSCRVKQHLRTLACSGTVRFKLDQLLDSVEFREQQILQTTREIRRFCQQNPELSRCIGLLRTIPGLAGLWPVSWWPGSGIGVCGTTSASWVGSWAWCRASGPPERNPSAARSPTREIAGCEANSSRPRGRPFDRTAS